MYNREDDKRVSFDIPKEIYESLKEKSKSEYRTISGYMRKRICEEFEDKKSPLPSPTPLRFSKAERFDG